MTTPEILADLARIDVPKELSGRHHKVMEASVLLFARQGYNATGIREIATASGLTSASLYHYAGNKDELLYQILDTSLLRYNVASEFIARHVPEPVERVANFVWMHVVTHASFREHAIVGDNEVNNLEPSSRVSIVERRDSYESVWREAIRAGMEGGLFQISDPSIVRIALLEACNSVSRWYTPSGHRSVGEIALTFVDIAFSMLRLRSPEASRSWRAEDLLAPAVVSRVWGLDLTHTEGMGT